jgi:hypothetical protein
VSRRFVFRVELTVPNDVTRDEAKEALAAVFDRDEYATLVVQEELALAHVALEALALGVVGG